MRQFNGGGYTKNKNALSDFLRQGVFERKRNEAFTDTARLMCPDSKLD
jgi:hypothetical protein